LVCATTTATFTLPGQQQPPDGVQVLGQRRTVPSPQTCNRLVSYADFCLLPILPFRRTTQLLRAALRTTTHYLSIPPLFAWRWLPRLGGHGTRTLDLAPVFSESSLLPVKAVEIYLSFTSLLRRYAYGRCCVEERLVRRTWFARWRWFLPPAARSGCLALFTRGVFAAAPYLRLAFGWASVPLLTTHRHYLLHLSAGRRTFLHVMTGLTIWCLAERFWCLRFGVRT